MLLHGLLKLKKKEGHVTVASMVGVFCLFFLHLTKPHTSHNGYLYFDTKIIDDDRRPCNCGDACHFFEKRSSKRAEGRKGKWLAFMLQMFS